MSNAPHAPTDLERRAVIEDLCSNRAPLFLADLYDDTTPGDAVRLWVETRSGMAEGGTDRLIDLLEGAGFVDVTIAPGRTAIVVRARRARSLADTVDGSMRLLVCGLNPSFHAADAGVGYAGPSNRFWPVVADVLGATPLDARALLQEHGLGMTDLVKRATASAAQLTGDEYRAGRGRVERLVQWLQPEVVCFVGLSGYRAAVDRKATTGSQTRMLGSRPVYVMPSTSGRNAHATRAGLATQLTTALRLADGHPLG